MSVDGSPLDAALDAAFNSSDSETSSTDTPEGMGAQVEPQQDAPAEVEAQSEAPAAPQTERQRDASGKFTPKAQQAAPAKAPTPVGKDTTKQPAAPAQKPEAPAAPAGPELKPPQHWKAAAREEWAKLPPIVQQEAKRIELETKRVMQESAQARGFADNFEKMITPYRALLTGEPLQVVGNLLQTGATLQTGTPLQKAQLAAAIIQNYQIDLPTLDALLSGQQPPQGQQQAQPQRPEQFRDPRVDEMLAREERQRTMAAQSAVDSFAHEAEFLDEPWPGKTMRDGSPVLVRDLVANLLDASAAQGVDLSLQEAYAQVVSQHPEVSKVLRQREEAQKAATAQATTQRIRAASSSVRSQPATRPASAHKASLDSILEEAWSSASGR